MMEDDRETVRVSLYDGCDGLNMTLPKAAKWMAGLAAKVPAEFAKDSIFLVEKEHDYYSGSSSLDIKAYYDRPETDEEMEQRLAVDAARVQRARMMNEQNERRIFEQLKAKYGA